MSAFSMAKAIRSSIRKIYIPIIVLLVFCVPCLGFTEYAFADVSNISNYHADYSGQFAHLGDPAVIVSMPDGSSESWTLRVDRGANFVNDYLLLYFRPDSISTYLGYLTLDISSIVNAFPIIYLDLPVASFDAGGNLIYNDVTEIVPIKVGQNYNNPDNPYTDDYFLFNNVNTQAFSGAGTEAITVHSGSPSSYVGFMLRFSDYTAPNGLVFTGSYTDLWQDNEYYFMCYVFQTLKYVYDVRMNFNFYIQRVLADGFANLNTEEYKLYKKTLQDSIANGLVDTNNKLDNLFNYGSGSFDDLEQDIGNASDNAEQGNQEIEDNAPKPDINNTHDDTTDIIDSVLTEHGANVSNILGAILGSNIVNGMLLISISVGAIKYIFFGKG